jgi:hypothetical protein
MHIRLQNTLRHKLRDYGLNTFGLFGLRAGVNRHEAS